MKHAAVSKTLEKMSFPEKETLDSRESQSKAPPKAAVCFQGQLVSILYLPQVNASKAEASW